MLYRHLTKPTANLYVCCLAALMNSSQEDILKILPRFLSYFSNTYLLINCRWASGYVSKFDFKLLPPLAEIAQWNCFHLPRWLKNTGRMLTVFCCSQTLKPSTTTRDDLISRRTSLKLCVPGSVKYTLMASLAQLLLHTLLLILRALNYDPSFIFTPLEVCWLFFSPGLNLGPCES